MGSKDWRIVTYYLNGSILVIHPPLTFVFIFDPDKSETGEEKWRNTAKHRRIEKTGGSSAAKYGARSKPRFDEASSAPLQDPPFCRRPAVYIYSYERANESRRVVETLAGLYLRPCPTA